MLRRRVVGLMEARGFKAADLARAVGHTGPWATAFLKGRRDVPVKTAEQIARFLRVDTWQLFTDISDDPRATTVEGFVALPLLGRPIAAGRPLKIDADPDSDHTLAFAEYFVRKYTRPVCLRVGRREESMLPTILPGDVIVIDQNPERRTKPKPGAIQAVNYAPMTGEPGGAVKRVEVTKAGLLVVTSDNPDKAKYPTEVFDLNHSVNLLDVLKGEVVWRGQYVEQGKRR